MKIRKGIVLLLALGLDLLFGDPPNWLHPVAWMGSLITYLQRFRPRGNAQAEFWYGGALILGCGVSIVALGSWLNSLFSHLPTLVNWFAEAVLLKSTFSLRGLQRAAGEVQDALIGGDLTSARRALAWHLVSRDTSNLDEGQVAAAAIESIAENASDGVVAPLFYYSIGGLPLALAYRFVNTADAMLGYHTPELEWLGKIPARLDDLVNLLPARLTGLLIAALACVSGGESRPAWHVMRRDARLTESPNAGYPMSAMAGALGLELQKVGHYCLGAGGRKPCANDIHTSRRILYFATGLAAILLALPYVWVGVTHPCSKARDVFSRYTIK